jgi:hypothetical protein
VRLPLPDTELRFIDLPMLYRGESTEAAGPPVRLRARFAGREHTWQGHIVRTEGEIDARSRMVNVVARVEDPYARVTRDGPDGEVSPPDRDRPPLAVGLFVSAEIQGRRVEDAISLPRAALRNGDAVLLVDAENRLRRREVDVLRTEDERVVIGGGLRAGDAVVVSPLASAVEGMIVRIEDSGRGGSESEEDADPGAAAAAAGPT